VLVHFESFRNVDLYHQGIYFLKSTLYNKLEGKVSRQPQSAAPPSLTHPRSLCLPQFTFGKPLSIFNARVANQSGGQS